MLRLSEFQQCMIVAFPQDVQLDLRLSVYRSGHKPQYHREYLGAHRLDDGCRSLSLVELSASHLFLGILEGKSRYTM